VSGLENMHASPDSTRAPARDGLYLELPEELVERITDLRAGEVAARVIAALRHDDARAEPWHLLDLDDAATRLGRSTRWVRDRVKAGELPYVRLDGGAFAFELDDLRSFARARRVALEEPEALAARLQAAHEPALTHGSGNEYRVHDRRVEA
jgi:hypothetical protein